MEGKKPLASRFLITVLISIWLIVFTHLDQLVLQLNNAYLQPKVAENFIASQNIHGWVDRITEPYGVLADVTFDGWGFGETKEDNSAKIIMLIIKSATTEYFVDVELKNREDLESALPHLVVPLRNQGFGGSFSAINLEDGSYELWLFVNESPTTQGYTRLNRNLIKSGNQLEYPFVD